MTWGELWHWAGLFWDRLRDWFLVFVAGGIIAPRLLEMLTTARLLIEEDPDDPMIGRPSQGDLAFFHVRVTAVRRWHLIWARPPKGVRAFVSIGQAINAPARWVDWPEPLADVPVVLPNGQVQVVQYPDRAELARQRTMDFMALDLPHRVDVAVKVEGRSEIYSWNNDNYMHGTQVDVHPPLGQGDYPVEIRLEYEGGTVRGRFRLSNQGTSWRDVRLYRV